MKHKGMKMCIFLVLCGALLVWSTEIFATKTSTPGVSAQDYTEVTISLGSVTKTVIATGALRLDKEESLVVPETVTVTAIDVAQGEVISQGQVLAHYKLEALQDAVDEARSALDAQDEELLDLLSQQSSQQNIKPSMAGVVKVLNLEAGQMVQESLQGQPAAILSTNGLMEVSITPTTALALGQEVRVKVDTQIYAGTVARLKEDESALITFPDTKALVDQVVQVTQNGVTLGKGPAQISQPYRLYTSVEGVVDSVSTKVNRSVTRNTTLFKIINCDPSQEYQEALEEWETLTENLESLEALLENPVYISQADGIVSEVSVQIGEELEKGATLIKLYPHQGFMLDVAVDELDILSVEVGQEGTVTLDALLGVQLPVRVEWISRLGTSSSGITSYTVTLSVEEDSRLLSGMNGTMTLTVGEHSGVVVVPLAAVLSDRNGSYVLTKDSSLAAGEAQTGIKTYVEVGLSDADNVSISAGLKEGEVILVRNSALTQTAQERQNNNMPGFGQMQNPGAGGAPGGNFQPEGGRR